MLVLTRRVGERIFIGDDVTITLLGVRGDKVRLGFEAPADIVIVREEVRQQMNSENDKSEKSKP